MLANEVCDPRVSPGQYLFIWKKHDSEVLGAGLLPEARAVDYHDVLLANEFFDEDLVALGDIDPRVCVECSAGCYTTHTRGGFAPLLREIAARPELALHLEKMILRAL